MKTLVEHINEQLVMELRSAKASVESNDILKFSNPQELAFAISKWTGKKAKAKSDSQVFNCRSDHGAWTEAKDVYEIEIDDNTKLQIGTAVRNSKSWMNTVKGEIIIRTAKKKGTLSGKLVFKWNGDCFRSYPLGTDFREYVANSQSWEQKEIFDKIMPK